MEEGTHTQTASGQRHVIERPRLTNLLDAANARIVLLTAPAGYGKTTLARQFARRDSRAAWYQATNASSDVAALASGLADAVESIVPGAGRTVRDAVRVSAGPSSHARDLAELFASAVESWPSDVWLVIDDYQYIAGSDASNTFVDVLSERGSVRLLIASRKRPTWATTRRLVYGEIFEVPLDEMAFTFEEARELLPAVSIRDVERFVSQTRGWPAVLGLASVSGDKLLPEKEMALALHSYFADELFQMARPELRAALARLALLPALEPDLLEIAVGAEPDAICREAVDAGFLTADERAGYEFHPLLRAFMAPRARDVATSTSLGEDIARALVRTSRWDEAFEVIHELQRSDLLPVLLEQSLDELLLENRVTTLELWIEFGRRCGDNSAILDVSEAEVARRIGQLELGVTRGLQAARHLDDANPLCARAWAVAGECAHLMAHANDAIDFHRQAEAVARGDAARFRAVWGQFVTSVMYEVDDPVEILERVRALDDGSTPTALRIAAGELHLSILVGGFRHISRKHEAHVTTLEHVHDALITTAFLSRLSWVSTLAARYDRGMAYAEQALAEAQRTRATFAILHLRAPLLAASIGLRRLRHAQILLDDFESGLSDLDDEFERLNMRVFRARLQLAHRRPARASDELDMDQIMSAPAASLRLEALALKALALSIIGRGDEVIGQLEGAKEETSEVQGANIAAFAVYAHEVASDGSDAEARLAEAVGRVADTENFDAFVLAYRAIPDVLRFTAERRLLPRDDIESVLRSAMDFDLARRAGIPLSPQPTRQISGLTTREREVYALLCTGLSNREISEALYIAESTVKVHVRHIFEKLGVRTRAQAMRLSHQAV